MDIYRLQRDINSLKSLGWLEIFSRTRTTSLAGVFRHPNSRRTIIQFAGLSRDTLHLAARYGELEAAKFLIKIDGSLVNKTDVGGWIPLHWAAEYNQLEICQLLIDCGSDINATDNFGNTPLHFCKDNMVRVLFLEHGAI